jgi:hypothetical protein
MVMAEASIAAPANLRDRFIAVSLPRRSERHQHKGRAKRSKASAFIAPPIKPTG